MDTKTKRALILLILILAIAGGASLILNATHSQNATPSETATSTSPAIPAADTPAKPRPATAIKPIQDQKTPVIAPSPVTLFTEPGSHECAFNQLTQAGKTSNLIYIAGGKMRAEFRSQVGTITTATLMIYTNGYLYTWKEGTTDGTKTRITSASQLPAIIPRDLASGKVLGTSDNNVSWDCHPWATDPTLLKIPSYVSFR